MQRYVVLENIRRFKALLERESLPAKRRLLEGLIHEEEAKLRRLDGFETEPPPQG